RFPLAAQNRLQRTRGVVQPGVEDAAVVAGLMRGELALLLENRDPELRPGLSDRASRRQPEDSAADDDDVEPIRHELVQRVGAPFSREGGTSDGCSDAERALEPDAGSAPGNGIPARSPIASRLAACTA